ncbi:diacylglycerol O-acyltransferase/wax synthase [Methylomarinovum caldicuralii]|uniref:Diacylglycerol O-acyltransferase/wax synthase n=1 Tax=Methylomarinovum caldicuralii TaxID=438856 RepID=A0AAU9CHI5_9GAMM|nr:hypothetical protein [Methylomarinovum caldicuralii]BCX82460.1 diacylglycerol O-acyltransferase/wax synthase [Methylomarinovum caldicuralii]
MTDIDAALPRRIPLNPIDHFLLQLDGSMRQRGLANVCTFAVTLEGRLERDMLQRRLERDAVYRWLARLRLVRRPFGYSRWQWRRDARLPAIQAHTLDEGAPVPPSLVAPPLDVGREPPLKIDLLHLGGRLSRLVFTWHHALMDAHGGEFLVSWLGGHLQARPLPWQPPGRCGLSLRERGEIARGMKTALYEASKPPFLALHRPDAPAGALHYRVLRFSSRQSECIRERARSHGAGVLASAFHLAAVAGALAELQRQRGGEPADALVPVPQDLRRRGAAGPLVGNQVSFLFYRIPAAALNDLARCTGVLSAQAQAFIRSGMAAYYATMMGLLQRLPAPWYRALLRSPTQGLMSTCSFSDTGEMLPGCQALFGLPLLDACHYPPNVHPPGLTFVFSRFRGALRISFAWMDGVIAAGEADLLPAGLKRRLLGDETGRL